MLIPTYPVPATAIFISLTIKQSCPNSGQLTKILITSLISKPLTFTPHLSAPNTPSGNARRLWHFLHQPSGKASSLGERARDVRE
jgi:hypothetical protein